MTIEYLFHYVFWDYSELKLAIGKFVAVEISIVWGILSLLFIYLLKKPSDKFIKLVPK